jgi:hypothetical protein
MIPKDWDVDSNMAFLLAYFQQMHRQHTGSPATCGVSDVGRGHWSPVAESMSASFAAKASYQRKEVSISTISSVIRYIGTTYQGPTKFYHHIQVPPKYHIKSLRVSTVSRQPAPDTSETLDEVALGCSKPQKDVVRPLAARRVLEMAPPAEHFASGKCAALWMSRWGISGVPQLIHNWKHSIFLKSMPGIISREHPTQQISNTWHELALYLSDKFLNRPLRNHEEPSKSSNGYDFKLWKPITSVVNMAVIWGWKQTLALPFLGPPPHYQQILRGCGPPGGVPKRSPRCCERMSIRTVPPYLSPQPPDFETPKKKRIKCI